MKVILDECLPRMLKRLLVGHEVRTVRSEGWNGIKNGRLLRLIETKFEAFITVDRGLEFQQKTRNAKVGIVVLNAVDNKVQSLTPLIPEVLSVLNRIKPGQVIRVPQADNELKHD